MRYHTLQYASDMQESHEENVLRALATSSPMSRGQNSAGITNGGVSDYLSSSSPCFYHSLKNVPHCRRYRYQIALASVSGALPAQLLSRMIVDVVTFSECGCEWRKEGELAQELGLPAMPIISKVKQRVVEWTSHESCGAEHP